MSGLRTIPAVHQLRKVLYWVAAPLASLFVAAGCVSASGSGAPSASPGGLASPVASPSPIPAGLATPVAGAAATPMPPATVDVTPPQVQVGPVTLSLALEPARHMLAQTIALASDPDPAHQAGGGDPTLNSTALVLEGLLSLTNNLDPSQPAPADQPQAMFRHVNLQVRTTDGGTPVPYLNVSMDMLLDGHPVASGLPVKPMLAAESTAPQLYYGNNLKLTQRGTYQVFVRFQPTALLGKDQPQTAQFNIVVR